MRLCPCLFLFPRVPVCLCAPLPARPPSVPKPPSRCARPPHIGAISGLGIKAQQLGEDASSCPRLGPRATRGRLWELPVFSEGSPSWRSPRKRTGGGWGDPGRRLSAPQWPIQALTLFRAQSRISCRSGNRRVTSPTGSASATCLRHAPGEAVGEGRVRIPCSTGRGSPRELTADAFGLVLQEALAGADMAPEAPKAR